MTDNELGILIRSQLLAGLSRQGMTAEVTANYQPTHQGRVDGPVLYFFQIGDYRYGWPQRTRQWNPLTEVFDTLELQHYETQFQVMALAPQDPENLALPTAKDLVNVAAMLVNSLTFVQALRAQDVGMQRATAVRNPYFQNDQGQFEASPSFDFTVSHKRVIIDAAPGLLGAEVSIHRV